MAKRKYEHRHLITRTILTTSGNVLYYDAEANKNKTVRMTVNGKLTAEQFLKAVCPDGIVLRVDEVETESKLYGMTIETFITHAEEITD